MSHQQTSEASSTLHIILFQPDIAPNTGNIGRTCAVLNARLHLIHPLGFELSEKRLRRAGMDYWQTLDVAEHQNWEAFLASPLRPPDDRIYLLTTHAKRTHWQQSFKPGDGLLFGKETSGCPDWLHTWAADRRLTIPQPNPDLRSLNLATSVGIVAYEAFRQFEGLLP